MSFQGMRSYAGDLSIGDAYSVLTEKPEALLVDVRTQAEWQFVGVPDLTPLGKTPIFQEWQSYPAMQVSEDFTPKLVAELERRGADKSAPVLFLCRSGARSRQAAIALTNAGWTQCYNIAEGFEGGHDAHRRRGSLAGWKASQLPWTQS
jgi:rhodanese-related sulfurtransferase